MPMPEGSQLNRGFSPILTSMAQSFIPSFGPKPNGMGGFIGRLVFPNVPVGAPRGSYNVWTRGDFLRLEAKKLANAEPAPIGGFSTTSQTFSTDNYGIASNWTARDLADARSGGISDAQLIRAKTKYVTGQAILRIEVDTATLIQTAGNWTRTWGGVSSGPTGRQFVAWDQAAAVPVDDIIAISQDMDDTAGFRPNTMVIPRPVYNQLRKNASLIDRIKYGGTMERPTQITLAQMKALFEIDNIWVPDAQYNSAAEGLTPSYTKIWNNNVWVGYVADSINNQGDATEPSAGYQFTWTGDVGDGLPGGYTGEGPASFGAQNQDGIFIREYETKRPAARYVEAELWSTPNVTAADAGITLTSVIS